MRRIIALIAVSATACSDADEKKPTAPSNVPPTAEISSHADGDTVREGFGETLSGTVGDSDHTIDQLTVAWLVDGTEVCTESAPDDAGLVTCDHIFVPGAGEVVLEVRDPDGGLGSAQVTLDVQPTDAPLAEITAPTAEGIYYAEHPITFQGTVSDAEDAVEDLTVTWETEALGDLGFSIDVTSEGDVEASGELEEGEHSVRLRVVDTTGKEGVDSVVINVGPPNSAPSCEITAPEDGGASTEGEEIQFEAMVADVDVPVDWLTIEWSSDQDDALGTSTANTDGTVAFAYSDLSINTHSITLTVTDEIGATCTDSIIYSVGTPPVLTVTTPSDGDVFNETEPVGFTGTVLDSEDLETDIALSWVSDIDGEFATDGADADGNIDFDAELTPGPHTITAQATDTDGLYDQTSFSITINQVPTQPTVTITPDPAYTDNPLTAVATGSTDPDSSGTVSYSYEWYEDGIPWTTSTTDTFPASETQKHSTYRVVVTPSDGTGIGPSGEAELTVDNSAPVLTGPSLSASTVVVGDTLTCAATATDADGDTVSITYAWSDSSTGATYTVTAADDPADTITCTATADDGDGGVVTGTASATVDNTDPVIDSIEVDPTAGRVGDTLTCTATASDADGGSPTITYAWSTGETGATYTIQASDDPGDTITCTATADDTDGGSASDTASAIVENTDPTVDSVSISPTTANNDDTLTCTATASDADGGTPTLSYEWTGSSSGILASIDTVNLSTTIAESGETITCTVMASDIDGGADVDSAALDLENRAPTVSVSLSPSSGATRVDTLTCTATVADDDDDSLTTTFEWTVEGLIVPASSTSGLTSTLAGAFAAGDEVVCIATTDDGKGSADSDSASTTITNTAPTLSAVTLDKSTIYTNDTLTASVTTSDAEGDTVTVTYDWYVESTSVQDSTDDTLNGASASTGFDKGESVYVVVVADDGIDTTTATSSTLVVSNTPPEAPVLSIAPFEPVAGEDLFCDVTTGSFDADGDAVTYSMTWTVDTGAHSGATTTTWTDDTVDGEDTAYAEVWECTATPNDGDDDGTTASENITITRACNSGSIELSASGVDFVEICAGSFDMGCTAGQSSCEGNESPVMPVTLTRNYYLSQTEITQGQYQAVMGSNPSSFSSCGSDCPVDQISWHMAAEFANALSSAEGLTECYECTGTGSSASCSLAVDVYTCDGYRLPTEAEWEGAARCETDFLYAGSDTLTDVAWYAGNSGLSTQPVASLSANDCGLYDMSGNVIEWTQDWMSSTYYTAAGRTDPEGPTSGLFRTPRGGSYANTATITNLEHRVAYRDDDGRVVDAQKGFRLARTVDGDYDGDGYPLSEDCDDTDDTIHPLAGDTYGDGIDSDCDSLDCEAAVSGSAYFAACPATGDWASSDAVCTGADYDGLATVESASETALILSLMGVNPTSAFWIGFNDAAVEGSWEWLSGRPVSYTNWRSSGVEPSGDGDCAFIDSTISTYAGEWNDFPCSSVYYGPKLSAVCEIR